MVAVTFWWSRGAVAPFMPIILKVGPEGFWNFKEAAPAVGALYLCFYFALFSFK